MAVIVVSDNSDRDLKGCLEALACDDYVGLVVIIDNASTDDSVAVARRIGGKRVEALAIDEKTGLAG